MPENRSKENLPILEPRRVEALPDPLPITDRQALEALPDAAVICTPEGHIRWASRRFGEMLGHDPQGLTGMSLVQLAAPLYRETVASLIFYGPGFRSTRREERVGLWSECGGLIDVVLRVGLVTNGDEPNAVVGLVRPTRNEETGVSDNVGLVAARGDESPAAAGTPRLPAPRSDERKYLEAARMELRKSLNGLTAHLTELISLSPPEPQQILARLALNRAHSLNATMRDVLGIGLAAFQDGRTTDFDLRATLEDLCTPPRQLRIAPRVPSFLSGHPGTLRRILAGLLESASHGTGQEAIALDVRRFHEDVEEVVLLFSVSSPIATAGDGDGPMEEVLVARRLVEALGGEHGFEQREGAVPVHWVRLRFRKGQRPTRVMARPDTSHGGRRVLCAASAGVSRPEVIATLRTLGSEVLVAETARGAMVKLEDALRRGQPVDAVLVDLALPDLEAIELARQVRANSALQHTALVLVADLGQPGDADWAHAMGFSAYVVKPVDEEVLRGLLQHVYSKDHRKSGIVTRHTLAEASRPRLRVLIVDDDQTNLLALSAAFERLGHFSDTAASGTEGIGFFVRQRYDLLLLDVRLPDLSGDRVTRFIREGERSRGLPRMPIITMSAFARPEDRRECLESGADGYWEKPITIDRLTLLLDALNDGFADLDAIGAWPQTAQTGGVSLEEASAEGGVVRVEEEAPIDLEHLDMVALGDPKLRKEIVGTFVLEIGIALERLRAAQRAADVGELTRLVDAAYGLCATTGAWPSARALARLEQALPAGVTADTDGYVENIVTSIERLVLFLTETSRSWSGDVEFSAEVGFSPVSGFPNSSGNVAA